MHSSRGCGFHVIITDVADFVTIFCRWQCSILRNGRLFLIFIRSPCQLTVRLMLGVVETAMSKTASALRQLTVKEGGHGSKW